VETNHWSRSDFVLEQLQWEEREGGLSNPLIDLTEGQGEGL
jgi:hypothetical protein